MATPQEKLLNYSTAKRQLLALVRKYNQASVHSLGFELDITFDNQEEPNRIAYTLKMQNTLCNAWEIRTVNSSLLIDLHADFTAMVNFMENQLTSVYYF